MNALQTLQQWFGRNGALAGSGLAAPMLVITVLSMMVLPLPPWLLDTFFTLNIALALVVMMVAAYMQRPLDFSVFPTVLLLTTLLRLSLNVASTRVVLLEGHTGPGAAGAVIEAFRPLPDRRQLRGRFDRVHHPGGDQLHRDHQGLRAHCRGVGPLHPGRHARQADGHRRRPRRRPDRREGGQAPPRRGGRRGRVLRLHGRCLQVRARRRHRRHPDPDHQHHGRLAIGMLQHGLSAGEAADSYILLAVGDALVAQIPAC
jgi:flagellar biosynthesis protein FlhA